MTEKARYRRFVVGVIEKMLMFLFIAGMFTAIFALAELLCTWMGCPA